MKLALAGIITFSVSAAAGLLLFSSSASAFTFNQNHIIDDVVFDNTDTMNAAHIDSFLNQFPNSCISTNSGFSAPDPTGYQPSPSQFLYSTSPVSAGTVIYDAAQAYGLNPEVLLATTQKEEGLVDGSGPYGCGDTAMASALGYGCTDSGTNTHNYSYPNGGLVTPLYYRNGTPSNSITASCVNSGPKAGFSEQVIHAAWLLKFGEQRSKGNINWAVIKGNWDNSDDPQSCYSGPMTQATWQICPSGGSAYYDGYTTIDGTAVHMDTGSTAALYWYTPHFPGNQNFFTIFTNWFGSTTVAGYAWSTTGYTITSLDGQTKYDPGQLQPGQTYLATLEAKNMGSQTWTNNGPTPVTLGTTDGNSMFCTSTWVACNRSAYLEEASVAPEQEGHFVFQIRVPYQVGSYREYFKPVAEELTWFNDDLANESLGIKVVSPGSLAWWPWGYVVTSLDGSVRYDPGKLQPGQTYLATLSARNVGSATWTNNGPMPVTLATGASENSIFCNSTWITCNRPAKLQEASVSLGQDGHFVFQFQVPYTLGQYRQAFRPVAEEYAWFGTVPTLDELGIIVQSPGTFTWDSALYKIQDKAGSVYVDPGQLATNTEYLVTLQARNTGTATWTDNGAMPVNLGTANPTGRDSGLCDTGWWSCHRPTTLQESSIPPGQMGHFVFMIKTPSTPGAYWEYFKPVAEEFAWFNDTAEPLGIVVH